MENIFVPTKNRLNNASFLDFAVINNVIINVVIEIEDYVPYKLKYPDFHYIILPESNKGITYVRNYIKNYTLQNGILNYWQIDDDITSFYYRAGTKLIKTGFDALKQSQAIFIKNNIKLGALEYRQFAWSATKELIKNTFCDSCVWVDNNALTAINYRDYVEGKEDRDFAMQVIKLGLKTARCTLYAFSCPPNGSNKGGLKEIFYDLGKEQVCVQRMIELWGNNICRPIEKDNGRLDVKILWDKINDNQLTLF